MNTRALPICVCLLALAPSALGAVTVSEGDLADLAEPISSTDLIQGMIAAELPGDTGWHPANSDPNDQLPALTDGVGYDGDGLPGLMNDFPGAGQPTKRIRYDLPGPVDVDELRVFSWSGALDGRIFQTYTAEFSSNGGADWTAPIYVQSHASGAGAAGWSFALTQLTGDAGALATGVDSIRLDFYAVDNTLNSMRDPFDGVNPFTGLDDGLNAAFVAPAIVEIDLIEVPEPASGMLLLAGGATLLAARRRRRR